MTSINKQKFLAELGKLLTFMYEEDRQRAIEMYSQMFEEAGDEQALIQSLISPTRQAVVVARAYNSNLGKLSLTSESKAAPEDRDENGIPDYVQAIESVREQSWSDLGIKAEEKKEEETVEEEPQGEESSSEETSEETETEEIPDPETENTAESDEPSDEETEEAVEEPVAEQETESEKTEEASEATESEESSEPEAEKTAEADALSDEAEPQDEEAASEEESAEPKQEETPVVEEDPAVEESPTEDKSENPEGIEFFTLPEAGKETPESYTLLDENTFNVDSDALRKPRRKPKVFALIVYILFAIPLTICAIAVLLIPAILFLALSIATIIGGVVLVSAAFKGFAVFADIMVVLGVSLVLFALGLLFLWTAIWFIGGAIVGVVHGVAVLCEKWCYKEVLET